MSLKPQVSNTKYRFNFTVPCSNLIYFSK